MRAYLAQHIFGRPSSWHRIAALLLTVATAAALNVVTAGQASASGSPTITALQGVSGPVTGGNTIFLVGTNFIDPTAVEFAGEAPATSFTTLSPNEIEAVVPSMADCGDCEAGTTYNVTVTTASGTSPTSAANAFYWFGSGTCTFSGAGVVNADAPPGASAYVQGASPGTTAGTNCSDLSGVSLTAPLIETLSDPMSTVVTGTASQGATGQGYAGNESWYTWTGQNSDYSTTPPTYAAAYVFPTSGPSTSGGCPLASVLCALGASEGNPVYSGTDPQGTCPPTQAETDAGFVDCSVISQIQAAGGIQYTAASLEVSYADDPTPDPATASLSQTTDLAAGQTIDIGSCSTCNWWGSGAYGAPGSVPSTATGAATAIPAPTVWVGATRSTAVQAVSTVDVTPATYNCGASGGAGVTSPGPTANCTLGQGTINGSFVVPNGCSGSCNVYIDEPNLSLTQSTYAADGGTGSYNDGLAYDLVNAVESTTPVTVGTISSPVVTNVDANSGPSTGGTAVTITGTGFTGTSEVDFGTDNPAAFTVVSDTQISATSPPGSGEVPVSVTTGSGPSSGDAPGDQFTYGPPTVTSLDSTSGPTTGGSSVTIDGADLSSAPTVTFGGNRATVRADSPDSVTVTTPPGSAGAADVTVSTVGGSVTDPGAFTYAAPPTITSLSPSVGPEGGGTSITVGGTNFIGVTSLLIGGTPVDNFSVTSPTSISVTSPPGSAGPADVSVIAGGGSVTDAGGFTYEGATCDPAVFLSADSATALANSPFSFTVTTCSTSVPVIKGVGLPSGLRLVNNANGTATISGTPGAKDAGTYAATITARVTGQATATQTFTITVDNVPVFKSKAGDLVHTGTAFSYPVTTVSGYPVPTITTASTLPDGVTLTDNHNGTADLAGNPDPTAGGVYPITITATNGIGAPVNQSFVLTVYQAPVIATIGNTTITKGVAMTPLPITATGYPVPKLAASGLPRGIKLTLGSIAGTTSAAAGTYTVKITASGKAGSTAETFTLVVNS